MERALLLALLLMGVAGFAGAQDATGLGGLPQGKSIGIASRTKSMSLPAAYAFGARSVQAPVISQSDQAGDAPHHQEAVSNGPHAGCEVSGASLCYDAGENHIVYRPARALMPSVRGLTPENISFRRHGIRLKYSFP